MGISILETILYNYNAVLALVFGLVAWYVAIEASLNPQVRARGPAVVFFFCLGMLNVINGLSKMAGINILAEFSLLFFLPMVIFLGWVGIRFRLERKKGVQQTDHTIDISLKVGALRLDPKTFVVLWASRGIDAILVHRARELIGQPLDKIIAAESQQEFRHFQEEVKHGNVPYEIEFALNKNKGQKQWIQLANTREYSVRGDLVAIISGVKNITERKHAEAEAELLREAIHVLPVGITISALDKNRTILYVNHTEATLHGYRFQDLLGQPVRIMTPKALWPLFEEHFTLDLLDGLDRETLNVRKNGDFLPMRLQTAVVFDQEHRAQALVSLSEPLIEPLQRQKTLYPGLNCLPMNFQKFILGKGNQHVMMIYFDRDRHVITCNRTAEQNLGYSLVELQDDIERICATPEDLDKALQFVFKPTRELTYLNIRTKAGNVIPQCWLGFHAIHGTLAMGFECIQVEENEANEVSKTYN